MMQITLDGSAWKCEGCFYGAVFEALGIPEPESEEYETLCASLSTGGFAFEITGINTMKPAAKAMVEKFASMVAEAKAACHPVDLVCNP